MNHFSRTTRGLSQPKKSNPSYTDLISGNAVILGEKC